MHPGKRIIPPPLADTHCRLLTTVLHKTFMHRHHLDDSRNNPKDLKDFKG